ncbi:RHS repeat-associated core domain-containing protein, partial [Frigoribacterium sp. UYMn621]|uniref:RHS repeat-associated core domain-containing protein n=1 Tax=Frigoribacterium sp. UYMn621 TaxID=3156343 RepID=UPI0033931C90
MTQNPYAFHSGIKDPGSGLVKFGLRWYNPTTGTWTQQDTLDAPLDPANANRYAYAGDDPINNLDPAGTNLIGLSCASEISVGAAAIVAGVGTAVAAGLADVFTGGVAILASAGEALALAGLVSGGVLFIGDGINSCNGSGIGLLRGFRTAELVDSSTLPGLAADNHSGLRWA